MNREQNVLDFYVACNKLKDVVRTGWKDWGVKRFRVESIAEHIYSVQMLALAMWSEYKYDIDIMKVITMLAVHEVEEIIIGDLTFFQVAPEIKKQKGHEAVKKMFSKLSSAKEVENLIYEFDARQTAEAKFAYYCDKLECDLQAKLYDEQNCVDLNDQKDNKTMNHPTVKRLLENGCSWSEMWLEFGQEKYNYDENFEKVSNFALNNKLIKK